MDNIGARFQIGRVLTDIWRTSRGVSPRLWPLLLGFVVLPSMIFDAITLAVHGDASLTKGVSAVGLIFNGLLGLAAQCGLIFGSVNFLGGASTSLSDALKRARHVYLPALFMGLLMALAILAGYLLLILPGMILALGWSVALPARVMEPLTITQALDRSFKLTEGYRWTILGFGCVIAVIYFGVLIVVGLVSYGLDHLGLHPLAAVFLSPVLSGLVILFGAAAPASVYHELIRIKEGGGATVADVFT